MPELRHDALTATDVIVAAERATRPHTNAPVVDRPRRDTSTCPFCWGHEHETPPEIARFGRGEPDTPGWSVRVVPNKYPLVGGALTGRHEVVILSPDHDAPFQLLADGQATRVLEMLRERSRSARTDGCPAPLAFVNEGRAAGASIEHPHAQLVALRTLPPEVAALRARFTDAGTDLVRRDLDDAASRGLIVADDGTAVAWCPHAAPSTLLVRVAAPDAHAEFADATDGELAAVAPMVQRALRAIECVRTELAYNIVIRSAPAPMHWHVEVIARGPTAAGFEFGSGMVVTTLPSELAADVLRDAWPPSRSEA